MNMSSVIASARAKTIDERVRKEAERIIDSFASNPNTKHRAVTKVVKRILLNGPYLLNGRMWEVKSRSLGVGVYELSITLKEE